MSTTAFAPSPKEHHQLRLMIDVRDTGDVAAEVLTGDGHNGKSYFLASIEATPSDFTAALSSELGKEIPFVQVPLEGAVGAMKERGMPDWLIDHQSKLMVLLGDGKMAGINDNIEQFSGHAARSLDGFVKDNAGAFSD